MGELSADFVKGAFFAICQRPPTNREMSNIMRSADNRRKAIYVIKSLPEANPFFNHFYNLSFNWVDSLLLVGEAPSPFQADILIEDGVNLFVNVSGQECSYSKYLPEHIRCSSIFMRNDSYNGPEPIKEAAQTVLAALADKRRVYVHCYSGISRSAAVVSIVVGCRENLPYNMAIEYVRSRRPIAHPHPDLLTLAEANDLIKLLRNEFYENPETRSPQEKKGAGEAAQGKGLPSQGEGGTNSETQGDGSSFQG